MAGTLYIVATPIGNLEDMTPRAAATFGSVDFIAAEDTRVTLKLLNHLGLKKPLVSYYEHNLKERGRYILDRIQAGEKPEDVAKFCLSYVLAVVEEMTRIALARCPGLPLIYAGGVMSNSLIRQQISRQFGGQFAEPAFSADNAAGAAVLAAWQQGGLKL